MKPWSVLVAGTSLILMEATGWLVVRFSVFWWSVQMFQMTVVLIGFLVVIRRIVKLEEETKSLRERLDLIARLIKGERSDGKDDAEPQRMLRSVS